VNALLQRYLTPHLDKPIKAVVLGCTHYPFLRKAIAALLPEGTPLVDGNAGTVRQLGRRLAEEALHAPSEHPGGKVTFLTSSPDPATLQHMQSMLETALAML
jgi:glutamate racemase